MQKAIRIKFILVFTLLLQGLFGPELLTVYGVIALSFDTKANLVDSVSHNSVTGRHWCRDSGSRTDKALAVYCETKSEFEEEECNSEFDGDQELTVADYLLIHPVLKLCSRFHSEFRLPISCISINSLVKKHILLRC